MGRGLFDRLQEEIADRERQDAVSPLDLLDLPDALRRLMQRILRQGQTTAGALAAEIGRPEAEVESMLRGLVEKGYLKVLPGPGPAQYKVVLGQRRARTLPAGMWDALAKRIDGAP